MHPLSPLEFGAITACLSLLGSDNLLNFDEGTSSAGWSVSSGSGTLSQSGSLLRLTSTSASAVTADLSIASPSSADFIILAKLSAKYASGQFAKLRLLASGTPVLDLSLGYDHEAGAATLGAISAYSTPAAAGNNLASGINYESTPQHIAVHIDRKFACVNLFLQESDGKWNFCGSFAYAANFSAITSAQIITSAHSDQWMEYDWFGFARPNMASIGDSICAGHNGYDPDPAFYGGEDSGDSTWQKHAIVFTSLRNTLIINKGVGGQTSTQILARISDVTGCGARLVFLHASSNDLASISKATRTSNIQSSIDAIVASGARCVLLNAMYGTSSHSQNTPAQLRDYMKDWWDTDRVSLARVSRSIDIMQPVLGASNYQDAALCVDTIHPSASGYAAIGPYITARL